MAAETRTFRILKILSMIPSEPNHICTDRLQTKLQDQGYNISLRQVQKDLVQCSQDFPITSWDDGSNKKHWYVLKGSYLFDIPSISPLSAFTFNLVEQFLGQLLPHAVVKQLEPHFKCAESYLQKLNSTTWPRLSEKIRILPRGQQLIPAQIKQEVFEITFEALWKEKQLKIRYRARGAKKATEYLVHPLGLVFRHEISYLICTLWGYDDVKQLALHRFNSVELLEAGRSIPKTFDLDEYINQQAFSYPIQDGLIRLCALFERGAAAHLHETPLSENQQLVEQKDGTILLEAEVQETSELHWWLLGFGDQVEVLEPKSLRKNFEDRVRKLAKKYKV